jgi:subtilisin family serine protease
MGRIIQRRTGAMVAAAVAFATAGFVVPSVASGGARPSTDFTAQPLSPASRVTGAKSRTGQLAESDAALLARTDSAPVNVVVKLDYDATASYTGDIAGLEATSPSVTGDELTGESAPEVAYEEYTKGLEDEFTAELAAAVPAAQVGRSLQRVYGGVAVRLPADQAARLLSLSNVAAVQVDQLNKPQTDSSTSFIGAPTIWAQNGGQALSGQGVIFGDLDTGVWPEHPSFADNPALGSPPAAPSGDPRVCDFGDNPLTPAADVFACNSKLIGGQPFIDTYNAVIGGEVYPDSARDSDGHGTHTTSTAAGGIVESAPIFGVERGPISGVAPGAWVIEYKVCGLLGCFGSDSAAAVEQAILDGVDVINFSISGGVSPYSDPVELAFLDAYEAGILVATSAGNEGPGAGTTNHLGPWTLTVAASTQTREFQSTLTVTDGVDTATFVGSSITAGVASPTPIVLAQNIPGYDVFCSTALAPGAAAGQIVACQRGGGIGRVQKGFNVNAGDAEGMILYNLPLQDTETDNHFLPAVHLADGTDFLAFIAAHPTASGSFTDGVAGVGQGDVMAGFSSRGPGGQFLKPDVTAPGVQILAGHTPTPDNVDVGPAGEYFQAIAGTSMSSPHAAGAAILLKSLHPDWTPGAIKSALMTTATTAVVKEDLVTPADPFDLGAGRIDLTKAGAVGLVLDESALDMFTLGQDPVTALDVNTPSVNAPTMPGTVTLTRTLTNVTGRDIEFKVSTTAPADSSITVSPDEGKVRAGGTRDIEITIKSSAPEGQYFGQININPKGDDDDDDYGSASGGSTALHLPVAFFNQQGDVTLAQTCAADTIRKDRTTTCTVTATNTSFQDATVNLSTKASEALKITSANGARVSDKRKATAGPFVLAGQKDAVPAIAPDAATPGGGYLPLELFGAGLIPIGDEEALNFAVPAFDYGGKLFTDIAVVSNGYVIPGGSADAADIQFVPQTLPDPAAPNGELATYWTDLDGSEAVYGVRVATLTDGVTDWLIVQWNLHLFGDFTGAGDRNFQVWIELGGVEGITYEFDTNAQAGTPPGFGLTVGAENQSGTAGAQIVGAPTGSLRVTTTPGEAGGSASYTLTVKGDKREVGTLTSTMTSDIVPGATIVRNRISVVR